MGLCTAHSVLAPVLASALPAFEWPQKVWEKRPVSEATAKVSESWFDLIALRLSRILRPDRMNNFWS